MTTLSFCFPALSLHFWVLACTGTPVKVKLPVSPSGTPSRGNLNHAVVTCTLFLNIYLLIWMAESEKERDRDPPCACSYTNCMKQQGLYLSGKQIWITHIGDRDSSTRAVVCCNPACTLAGSRKQGQSQDLNPGILMWKSFIPTAVLNVCPFKEDFFRLSWLAVSRCNIILTRINLGNQVWKLPVD